MIDLKYESPIFLYDKKLDNEHVVKLEKIKKGEKISILSDNMFRTMILNTARIKYSAQLFPYFLEVSYEDLLKNIKLVKSSFDKNSFKNKGIVGDYVVDINGTLTNLEINNNSSIEVMERNTEYTF